MDDFFWLEPMTQLYSFFEVVPEQMQKIQEFYPNIIVVLDGLNYQKVKRPSVMEEEEQFNQCKNEDDNVVLSKEPIVFVFIGQVPE